VDGVLEATTAAAFPIFGSSAPLNIGAESADGAVAASSPFYGRVDEAFVTADVLTEDQVRALYAARIAHTLGALPKSVSLSVRRQRKGAALATTDFITTPLRLYNFTGGDLAGAGSDTSGNRLLTNNNGAVSVAGADGTLGGAFSFAGAQSLSATDAGLPGGTATRSYGAWFKTPGSASTIAILSWGGAPGSTDVRLLIGGGNALQAGNGADGIVGPFVADGQWHFAVATEDNAAGDGVRRKLYADGRLVGGSTVLNAVTLTGANRFRVGAYPDATAPFTGQIDGAFVTGYVMTTDEVLRLYAKGSQALAASPKNAGDHVEGFDSGSLLVIADTLEAQHYIDLALA
jgi:hypothetical protein